MLAGVISDTHGYFDDRVLPYFEGVDLILHAGDVGSSEVLTRLAEIAPVFAVEGNNDVELELGIEERADDSTWRATASSSSTSSRTRSRAARSSSMATATSCSTNGGVKRCT